MLFNNLLYDSGLYLKTVNKVVKRNITVTVPLYKRILNYPKLVSNEILKHPRRDLSSEDEILNSLKNKLIYNSTVTKKNSFVRWKIRQSKLLQRQELKRSPAVPFSLKYFCDTSEYDCEEFRKIHEYNSNDNEQETDNNSSNNNIHLPYSIVHTVDMQSNTDIPNNSAENLNVTPRNIKFNRETDVDIPIGKMWMNDYEVYDEDYIDEDQVEVSNIDYGTEDPNILPSNVPCGGCGAHLHCQNHSIPGYLPKEIFLKCSNKDLQLVVCQRCIFLKHYNIALSVNVDSESYPKLISSLKDKNVLIVFLVDMTDFPCSIWPQMLDLIGADKPIILVGNKIDLIPGDSPGWLEHATKILRQLFPSTANILHTTLISAKNGYGVEALITKIQAIWSTKGDVYLIGCTNVGKSSLFNDLLRSDFCKSKAVDLIQRATIAPWPGTTLNLLKFPILKINSWRIYLRTSRLSQQTKMMINERKIEQIQARENKTRFSRLPKIIGQIGLTFKQKSFRDLDENQDNFEMPTITNKFLKEDYKETLDPNDPAFKNSKWCYDTPGVVQHDQIINILTTDEIVKTLPESVIKPKIFSLYSEQTLFIGGLARLDLLSSEYKFIRVIVYASNKLPITLCQTEFVDDVYNTLLGTSFMAVPSGSNARLKLWPALKSTNDFEMVGVGNGTAISDIVLSNAGWVSLTTNYGSKFVIRPFTPDGRGIHLRKTPLLRYTSRLRRKRIPNTPTYFISHF